MTEAVPTRVRMTGREWMVVALLAISTLINYVDRTNLSLALPMIEREFTLTPREIASLLAAFFWTYALLQLFGITGWLCDRFQPGWVLFWGFLLWTAATAASGMTTTFAGLLMLRLLLGAGETVAYPCYSRVFATMPQEHRGRANALIDVGAKLGPAAASFVGGLLLVHFGWRTLFLGLGLGGMLWLAPWWKAMPRVEPNPRETAAVAAQLAFKILRLRCAWGTFLGHFSGNYFFYFLLAWLPRYLVLEDHRSIQFMSRLTALLYLLIAFTTMLAGWTSDRLIAYGISPSIVRRSMTAGGLALASSMVLFPMLHAYPTATIVLLALSSVGYGAFSSNHWAIAQTLAGPTMAGRWSSLQNGVANFSGIAAPWVAGLALERYGNSRLAFAVAGVVAFAGALSWTFLVRKVEAVDWGVSRAESLV